LEKIEMKKTLVAYAALAAVSAFAQSSVTVYGVVDQGIYNKKSDISGTATSKQGIGDDLASSHGEGGLAGSRIGFKGTEDLGGGTSANFTVEMGLYPSQANNYGPNGSVPLKIRQGYISLANSQSFGEIQMGRVYTHVWATQNGNYDFGLNNNMYGYIVGQNGSGNRQANAINYISPNMNGFTAGVLMGFGQTSVTTGNALTTTTGDKLDEVTSFSLAYSQGPLKVNFANEKTKNHTLHDLTWSDPSATAYAATYQLVNATAAATTAVSAPDTTVNALGVSYDFGSYKLGYHNSSMALQGDTNYNSTADLKVSVSSISGEATFGNSIFFGSYSKANNNASSQVSIKSNQLGARYLLSKRTDAYYIIGSNTISVSGSTNYVKQSGNIIGIRHQF